MKLYRVLFLIFFSGILFVGAVNDISASTLDSKGPYEAYVHSYRFGGIDERLHVYMYARASSR